MDFYRISAKNTEKNDFQVLPLPFAGFEGSGSPTRFLLTCDDSGLTMTAEAEFCGSLVSADRPPKGRVFEDDCLELFLRPQISEENPFPAAFYYGWEVNPAGSLLEYRAGIGAEGERMIGSGSGLSVTDGSGARPGVEPVFGILHDTICGQKITFDYDWHSGALVKTGVFRRPDNGKLDAGNPGGVKPDGGKPSDGGAGLWRLTLKVPWSDFGLAGVPKGERWYFTVNRIEQPARGTAGAVQTGGAGNPEKPGLATLLSGTETPAFHQPDSFAPLEFAD